jgi:hypothetical protein
MPRSNDLIGQKFGRLQVVSVSRIHKYKTYFFCVCDCNTQATVEKARSELVAGKTRSCGCLRKEIAKAQLIDLTGQRFGRLFVKSVSANQSSSRTKWLCVCDCDPKTTLEVAGKELKNGESQSCGCIRKEQAKRLGQSNLVDLIGQRFCRLTVKAAWQDELDHSCAYWLCVCDCDPTKLRRIAGSSLITGKTKSCGCLNRDTSTKQVRKLSKKEKISVHEALEYITLQENALSEAQIDPAWNEHVSNELQRRSNPYAGAKLDTTKPAPWE